MTNFITLLEASGTLLDALKSRRKGTSKKIVNNLGKETPRDRFIMLMNHKEWGPGIMDFVRRNNNLTIQQLISQVKLKPDLKRWMLTGFFQEEQQKKPPTRQEIHDLNYRRDRRREILMSMITQKPREDSK